MTSMTDWLAKEHERETLEHEPAASCTTSLDLRRFFGASGRPLHADAGRGRIRFFWSRGESANSPPGTELLNAGLDVGGEAGLSCPRLELHR